MPASPHAVDWLDRLNPEQRSAVTFGETAADGRFVAGPLLVIAGAGTGKTNTLAYRVAQLVLAGVPCERLLLLTFTRRAAREMIHRAERIVAHARGTAAGTASAPEGRIPWAGTFHAIGNRLLRQYAVQAGLDPGFSIIDRGDAADVMDVVRQELGLARKEKRFPRKDTCLAIYSHRVNTQQPLEHTLETVFPWCAEWADDLTRLYRRYVEVKARQNVLDYDDLLLYWHALVGEPALASDMSRLFDHVLVDEYQDTNRLQAEILLALKPDGCGLCVVGDDAQSIYSFRAASVDNILGFPTRFAPPAAVVALERNYRSVQPVLDAANALIGEGTRQYRKSLQSSRASQQRPWHVSVVDDRAQAEYVVSRILEARERGVALKHQAVLFRSSHHSDMLELELVRRNIPYVKYGGLKFLEAAHVKDLLAVLRWADNPRNGVAAFRALKLLPGMGPAHADRCLKVFAATGGSWSTLRQYRPPAAACEDWRPFSELMASLADWSGPWAGQVEQARRWYEPHLARLYDDARVRAGDLEQLERIAAQFSSRERFLSELALDPPQATGDLAGTPLLDEDYLVLSTIHSAKGQEWASVFVLNVADGTFPSEFATSQPAQIEEERRLLYVALTRARDELHLVCPLKYYVTQQPRHGDAHVYGARSRFLTDAVMSHLECISWPSADATSTSAPTPGLPRIDVAARLRGLWS